MKKEYLVGIDVGTTGTKVLVFDLQGKIVSEGYKEYPCLYPNINWVEQDPEVLVEAVYECCYKAIKENNIEDENIRGIGVSAQRSSVIFMDEDHNPLKMISWLDNRGGEEVKEISEKIGTEKFYEITGLPLCTTWILPKILHTRKNDPELFNKTKKIIQLQDFIIRALGVNGYYSDVPDASFYGFWDNKKCCYSDEILKTFELDQSFLSEVKRPGEPIGEVSQRVSEKTGLKPGTPICIGIGDQNSAAIGAGIIEEGMISISIGTGGLATALLKEPYRDPKGQTMVTNHGKEGLWTFEGLQNAAAGAYRWFRDEISAYEKAQALGKGEDPYKSIEKMIENSPVGAKGLLMLPFFAGSAAPRWNAEAKGGFLGLTFGHTRGDMARACIEGVTLEQKDIINSIVKNGVSLKVARIMGGATKSALWNQVQADIYNMPCETLKVTDAAALGAAICAGVGAEIFKTMDEGVKAMVHIDKRYEPKLENVKKYEEIYGVYCDVFDALEGASIFKKLEKLQNH